MTWIVDIELVAVEQAQPPDRFLVTFDVVYPGETWCRSLVYVAGSVVAEEQDPVSVARDALVPFLETEGQPVSLELRLTTTGPVVLGRRLAGPALLVQRWGRAVAPGTGRAVAPGHRRAICDIWPPFRHD